MSTDSAVTAGPQPLAMTQVFSKACAELVGTFALVFAGCGAVMVNEISGGAVTHVGIALTFGLIVMVMIYATGHVSGAHFNPAVTIAFAAVGRFPWRQVPVYVLSQFVAAIAASAALRLILGDIASLGSTMPSGTPAQSLGLEVLLTLFLMFVIAAVATDSRACGTMAGVAIGGTVAPEALFGGPISGASMNPARSLGPALVDGTLTHQWIYVAGPLLGSCAGAFLYQRIRCGGEPSNAKGCC